jgi:hypothetical protein
MHNRPPVDNESQAEWRISAREKAFLKGYLAFRFEKPFAQ